MTPTLSQFKNQESAKENALNIIRKDLIRPGRLPGTWLVSGSKGETYTVDTITRQCGCEGFKYYSRCKHLVAAEFMELL